MPLFSELKRRIIMVLLAVALGYFAFDKFVLDPSRDAELVEETTQQVRSDALLESFTTTEHIVVTDPISIEGRSLYRLWLGAIGRIEEAHEHADLLLAQSPGFGYSAHSNTSLIWEGKIAEGLSWALRGLAGDADDYSAGVRVKAFIWVGEYDEARRVDDELAWVVDVVEGRFDEAIQGRLRDPQVFDDLIFEVVWQEPRFIALQQELDVILAVEHDKVLQLICFNNPVPGDWRPLPETCDGVERIITAASDLLH